jgi:hypothetical protein
MDEQERTPEEVVGDLILGEEAEEQEEEQVEEQSEEEQEEETEEEREVEPAPEGDEEEFVDIEHDGQLYAVPPSLKDAFLRNSDYTQKTQEVAAQRKEVEAQREIIAEAQKAYQFAEDAQKDTLEIMQFDVTIERYEQYIQQNATQLDANQIAQAQMELRTLERERNEKFNALDQKRLEFQQARDQSLKEILNKGTEVLRSKISDWSDDHDTTAKEYGLSLGFTERELANAVDPRQRQVLWEAAQFRALQKGKTAAVKKVQDAPTIKAKSRNPMPKETQDKLNFRKKLKSSKLGAKEKVKEMEKHFGALLG